jgi:hypothetical protein
MKEENTYRYCARSGLFGGQYLAMNKKKQTDPSQSLIGGRGAGA